MDHQQPFYRGLGHLLYAVRWVQHFLSIVAEVLILLSFAMSGMDVALGGSMAAIPLLKILWAAMFALGIDTAFALSWVRVRQSLTTGQWGPFVWNLLLAAGISFIIFEPIAIQLLQQTLNLSFEQAVDNLGINLIVLTYARAGVAVFLGAILAMTNTGHEGRPMSQPGRTRHIRIRWPRLRWRTAKSAALPVPAQIPTAHARTAAQHAPATSESRPTIDIAKQETMPLPGVSTPVSAPLPPEREVNMPAQQAVEPADTPEQRAARVGVLAMDGLSAQERVATILSLFPSVSDRELGRLSGIAAATAKKHRMLWEGQRSGEES